MVERILGITTIYLLLAGLCLMGGEVGVLVVLSIIYIGLLADVSK